MKPFQRIIAIGVCLFIGLNASAQEEENVGNVEINVFDSYKAKVREARKLSQQPSFDDTTTQKIDVDYDFSPRIVETQIELDPIPAAKIARVSVERLPHNMVKLGVGNYTTPELSLIFANSRNRNLSWSLAVDHFSTFTGALRDRVVFNDNFTMRNQLRANVKNVGRTWRSTTNLNIDLRDYSYYGVPKLEGVNEVLADSDPTRQRYYTYGIQTRAERIRSRGAFEGVDVGYQFLHDRYAAQEHYLKTMADWVIGFENVDMYLGTGVDYLDYSSDSSSTSSYAVRLKPTIKHEVNGVNFTVGLNLNLVGQNWNLPEVGDTSDTRFYFYPEIKAELPLVRDVLNIFGGWVGNVDLNGLSGISDLNPYIAPGAVIRETGVNKFYAGFSGRISRRFGYNLQADYFRYSNRALFSRDSLQLFSGFDPFVNLTYTDLDVLAPRVELTYHHPSGVEVSGDATYLVYNLPEDGVAYHLPDFKGGLHVSYTWKEKITLKTDFVVTGPRLGLSSVNDVESGAMPTFYDWRLYGEYKYNDYLNFYLSVNNILNQDYDLWYGYPAQGIRFILGLAVRF